MAVVPVVVRLLMQLWIQHKKLQRNGGKRLDLLVLAMGNLEVQCMNLGLFLEMMDMDFNQFLGGGNRSSAFCYLLFGKTEGSWASTWTKSEGWGMGFLSWNASWLADPCWMIWLKRDSRSCAEEKGTLRIGHSEKKTSRPHTSSIHTWRLSM